MSLREGLAEVGIDALFWVPDSLSAPVVRDAAEGTEIELMQVSDEATAICLASGFGLTGGRALVVMENSGLRRACEVLSRLGPSHGLYCVMLLSYRGAFGDRQWWADGHHWTMRPLLEMLGIRYEVITEADRLAPALIDAFEMFAAGQRSVAVVVHPAVFEVRK